MEGLCLQQIHPPMPPTPGSQCEMAQPAQGKHTEQAIPREDNQPLRVRKKKGEAETSPVHQQLLLPLQQSPRRASVQDGRSVPPLRD